MRSHSLVSQPLLRFLAAVPLLLAVAGCDPAIDVPTFYSVTYRLTNLSLESFTELTYIEDIGARRSFAPGEEDYESQWFIPEGQSFGATAAGTVRNGEIVLEIIVEGGGREFTRSDSCENLLVDPVACSLEIPDEVL
jgi:hypothetical protein